jgi:hypothetical protein
MQGKYIEVPKRTLLSNGWGLFLEIKSMPELIIKEAESKNHQNLILPDKSEKE